MGGAGRWRGTHSSQLWLPHTAPFPDPASRWLWWVFSGVLAATSVTDLLWRRIVVTWPQVGLVASAAVGVGFGLWWALPAWAGLAWTVGLGLLTIPALWLMHARLAAGDWWLMALGALSFVLHPAYFGLWVGLSLALASIVGWFLFRLQRVAEPLPFLPLALVGDLLVRTAWAFPSWR
ncbi:hypothetical protein [Sulfobacillus harzensis]|uniref:Uncharacterized protein n=1 Tax=Sulfobacillus harzensis TaxID=2729629 RepID=A0A7Y0L7H5_9FIRM|nr:hypothetical protein [Sulfobacillus harzensis]NMP24749.1 hypothetical protein [Sulfobacillus harzensis]